MTNDLRYTFTDVVRIIGVAPHRLRYAILKASIKPAAKFGPADVFTDAEVEAIRAALSTIQRRERNLIGGLQARGAAMA